MSSRPLRLAAVAALIAALGLAAVPTRAQETEISGRVEGVVVLSLRHVSPESVRATVTATVPGTALSVSQAGRPARAVRTYEGPVTNARVTVRTSGAQQTITFGPQSP